MKKILSTLLILSTTTLFAQESLKVDPSAQAKADKQMKLQNRNVIKHVIDEYSNKLPQKVDEYTSFVNIKSEDLTLVYVFEINSGVKTDETIIKEDRDRMSKVVTYGICNSSKRFLESDINIAYVYNSAATKKQLFRFDVTKTDCPE